MLITLVKTIHIVVCLLLIAVVLLQQGKGADMGATFGGGGNTLFGAAGADTLLTKITTGIAVVFMTTSVVLAVSAKSPAPATSPLFQQVNEAVKAQAPATSVPPAKDAASPAAAPSPAPENNTPAASAPAETSSEKSPSAEAPAAAPAASAKPAEAPMEKAASPQ